MNDTFEAMHDPRWRLENLYTIQNKQGNRVPFKPNAAQNAYLDGCTHSDLILKARQLGMTTLMCIIGLDEALFKEDWRVAIIAHTLNDATEIFETKVKFPYDNLPEAIRNARPAKQDRAGLLRFDHGSSIRVATSARSGTLQRLHISEFGKICSVSPNKAREIVTGSFPAVGKNTKTIESTAEGQEGYFYQFSEEAQRGEPPFKFFFFAWWMAPQNTYASDLTRLSKAHDEYFKDLEIDEKITLTAEKKSWWANQEHVLGTDMKRAKL